MKRRQWHCRGACSSSTHRVTLRLLLLLALLAPAFAEASEPDPTVLVGHQRSNALLQCVGAHIRDASVNRRLRNPSFGIGAFTDRSGRMGGVFFPGAPASGENPSDLRAAIRDAIRRTGAIQIAAHDPSAFACPRAQDAPSAGMPTFVLDGGVVYADDGQRIGADANAKLLGMEITLSGGRQVARLGIDVYVQKSNECSELSTERRDPTSGEVIHYPGGVRVDVELPISQADAAAFTDSGGIGFTSRVAAIRSKAIALAADVGVTVVAANTFGFPEKVRECMPEDLESLVRISDTGIPTGQSISQGRLAQLQLRRNAANFVGVQLTLAARAGASARAPFAACWLVPDVGAVERLIPGSSSACGENALCFPAANYDIVAVAGPREHVACIVADHPPTAPLPSLDGTTGGLPALRERLQSVLAIEGTDLLHARIPAPLPTGQGGPPDTND